MQSLLNMGKKKNRKQAEAAITALRDLFCDSLLGDDRKLWSFSKNPILNKDTNPYPVDAQLLSALYDHLLKDTYNQFAVNVLKPLTHDDLDHYRKSALDVLEYLLERKPENEEVILEIIVNKLGDTSKKIQCHTIYLLLKLTQKHKEMAEVLVREVHLFMTRANTKNTHLYYSIAYLNRVAGMVASKDEKVRVILFRIYFSLFKRILKTEKDDEVVEEIKKDRSKSKF